MTKRSFHGMAGACLVIALLVGAASGLGLFVRGTGSTASTVSIRGEAYDYVTTGVYAYNAQRVVAEGIGWDIVTLFMAVPALLLAALLVWKGSFRGRVFAVGLLAYFFYQYLMYAMSWAFGPLFPLFILIFALSGVGLAWIVSSLDLAGRFTDKFPRRSMAVICLVLAAMLLVMWSQRIAAGFRGDWKAAMLLGETTLVVQAIDLGFLVPLTLACGFLVLRRRPAGYLLGALVVVKMVAMGTAISAMLLSAWKVEGKLEMGGLLMFAAIAIVGVVLGLKMFQSVRKEPV